MQTKTEKVRGVVFDVGGVILDYQGVIPGLARVAGRPENEARRVFEKWDRPGVLGILDEKDLSTLIGLDLGLRYPARFRMEDEVFSPGRKAIVETHHLIEELQGVLPLGILSNAWRGMLERCEVDGHVPPSGRFGFRVVSAEEGLSKPDERIFWRMIDRTRLLPQQVLCVDDNWENCEAARGCGLQVVHFNTREPEGSVKEIRQAIYS